jgi:opacity protein-like surface antigen
MKKLCLILLAAALLATPIYAAQVTNLIDNFTTSQSISTNNASATNTVTAPSAIGGFRTMSLTTAGDNLDELTSLFVSSATQRLTLNTPVDSTPNFQLKWGGANGNTGLGADFGDGQPLDLLTSFLSFSLRGTDISSSFTWQFIDSTGLTATYNGNFPVHSSTSPALPIVISFDSFANASSVNWNAIDYIVFSGGGQEDLDMTINAPFQVVASTVPEPGTWALFVAGLAVATFVLRRRAAHRD